MNEVITTFFESCDDILTIFFLDWGRQTSTCTLVVEISNQQFIKAIKTMKGLFINLIAINVSEISDNSSSATFTKFCFCQNFQIKVRNIVVHRYTRFKVKKIGCVFSK